MKKHNLLIMSVLHFIKKSKRLKKDEF